MSLTGAVYVDNLVGLVRCHTVCAMTVPPPEDPDRGDEQPLDFDPYRFGKPDHPIPPEYAPPGYVPPQPAYPPNYPPQPVWPPSTDQHQGYPAHNPYPYPPPPPGYPYGVQHQSNTKATVALVLGILSIVFCWLSIFDLLLIVPAIVFGALGRRDAARFPDHRGKNAATSGLICGIVAVVLAVAATVFVYTRVRDCVDNYDTNSSAYRHCVNDKLFGSSD